MVSPTVAVVGPTHVKEVLSARTGACSKKNIAPVTMIPMISDNNPTKLWMPRFFNRFIYKQYHTAHGLPMMSRYWYHDYETIFTGMAAEGSVGVLDFLTQL